RAHVEHPVIGRVVQAAGQAAAGGGTVQGADHVRAQVRGSTVLDGVGRQQFVLAEGRTARGRSVRGRAARAHAAGNGTSRSRPARRRRAHRLGRIHAGSLTPTTASLL